jgi:hypothetical protein
MKVEYSATQHNILEYITIQLFLSQSVRLFTDLVLKSQSDRDIRIQLHRKESAVNSWPYVRSQTKPTQKCVPQIRSELRDKCLPQCIFSGKSNDSSPPIIETIHVLQTFCSVTQLNNAHRRGREIGIVTKGISLLCMHITLTFLLPLCASVVDKGDKRPQMFLCQMDIGTTERSACDFFVRFQPFNKLACACPCEVPACYSKFRILINYRGPYPFHRYPHWGFVTHHSWVLL